MRRQSGHGLSLATDAVVDEPSPPARPGGEDSWLGRWRITHLGHAVLGHTVMGAVIELREEDFPTPFLKTAA